jgi:hypothetical protein
MSRLVEPEVCWSASSFWIAFLYRQTEQSREGGRERWGLRKGAGEKRGESEGYLWGDSAVSLLWFLRIARVPDLDFEDIFLRPTSTVESILKIAAIVVSRGGVAHEHVSLSSQQHLEIRHPVLRHGATEIIAKFGEDGHEIVRRDVFGCIDAVAMRRSEGSERGEGEVRGRERRGNGYRNPEKPMEMRSVR